MGGSGLHPRLQFLPAQPMNATSAFGPNLRYIVKWRRRETRETWNNVTVWGSRYVVGQTPVYVPYEIRVQAENDFGKGPEPDTVIGYSGEDCEYPPSCASKDPPSLAAQGQPHRPGTSGWVIGPSENILGGQSVPRKEKSPMVKSGNRPLVNVRSRNVITQMLVRILDHHHVVQCSHFMDVNPEALRGNNLAIITQ